MALGVLGIYSVAEVNFPNACRVLSIGDSGAK